MRSTPIEYLVYRFLWKVDDIVNIMPKDRKHTIGQKILCLSIDMFDDVRTANDCLLLGERQITLEQFRSRLNKIEVLVKMSHEKGFISDKDYIELSEYIEGITKQQTAWYKATIKKRESGDKPEGAYHL